jgi:ketosteroid isomerase-like protein
VPERAPEVEDFVRDWLDAKQAGNGRRIGEGLSGYDGALAIGTDASEWWAGRDAFTEAHTATGPFAATITALEAHREGPVAWAVVRAAIETGDASPLSVRLTLVLVRHADSWRIVQSHASLGAPE